MVEFYSDLSKLWSVRARQYYEINEAPSRGFIKDAVERSWFYEEVELNKD